MTEKAYLNPGLTLRPARWTDLDAVAKLSHEVAEMEGDSLFLLRVSMARSKMPFGLPAAAHA